MASLRRRCNTLKQNGTSIAALCVRHLQLSSFRIVISPCSQLPITSSLTDPLYIYVHMCAYNVCSWVHNVHVHRVYNVYAHARVECMYRMCVYNMYTMCVHPMCVQYVYTQCVCTMCVYSVYVYSVCVYSVCACACIPKWGGHMHAWGSEDSFIEFSPPFTWALRIELQSLGLCSKCLYLQNYLPGPRRLALSFLPSFLPTFWKEFTK